MARRSAKRCSDDVPRDDTQSELSQNTGTLYVVSTPIGNLDDISLRAIRVLRSVKIVAAEDARAFSTLMAHYGIETEVCSLKSHAYGTGTLERVRSTLLAGNDAAVVCDAGTPLIADPGGRLVNAAIEIQCRVAAVPGSVAAIAALTISGLSAQRFTFDGFPPRGSSDRFRFFSSLATETRTIVLYETRSHLSNTLMCLRNSLGGDRQIAVVRDLTRRTEATYRGLLRDIAEQLGSSPPRGEYVLVIEGHCPI